jgi:hypothetical protein
LNSGGRVALNVSAGIAASAGSVTILPVTVNVTSPRLLVSAVSFGCATHPTSLNTLFAV